MTPEEQAHLDVCQARMQTIAKEFTNCSSIFAAIGDETRQLILLALLGSPYGGMRVGALTQMTHLSRPAVSHHLQILKRNEVIAMRREIGRAHV